MAPRILYSENSCLDPYRVDPKLQIADEPEYCECAYFEKRPLSWDPYPTPYVKSDSFRNADNLEMYHEHVVFQASNDNIGWGNHGLFSEDTTDPKKMYVKDSACFDGTKMRQAVLETEPPSIYTFIGFNCQTYADRLKTAYQKIVDGITSN